MNRKKDSKYTNTFPSYIVMYQPKFCIRILKLTHDYPSDYN